MKTSVYCILMNDKLINTLLDAREAENFVRIHENTDLTKYEDGHYPLILIPKEISFYES